MPLKISGVPLPSVAVFTHFPIDWVIVVALVTILTLDALRSGASRAAAICFAWPAAIITFQLLPNTIFIGKILSSLSSPVAQAAVFLILLVIFFALIYRTTHIFGNSNGFLFALLAGVSATVTTVALWIQAPALQALWHFGPQVTAIFGGAYTLFWLIVSYILLAFVRS